MADAHLNNVGLRTYSDMHQGASDLYLAAHSVCTGPLKRRPTQMDALRAACTSFVPALPLTSDVLLTLTVNQARELRECIDADVMDLSTISLDDEDQAKVAVLHTVLARLDALLAGVA